MTTLSHKCCRRR